VETASRLCTADGGAITIREGEAFRFVAAHGVSGEFSSAIRGQLLTEGRGRPLQQQILQGHISHIADILDDPEYRQSKSATVGKLRTILIVPMLRDGTAIGALHFHRLHVESFSERQIELVRTFADQAVIAIENTRLLDELRESLAQQQAIAEVLALINGNPGNLQPVFDAMLERAARLCEADTGHLFRFENGAFFRLASRGVSQDFDRLFPLDTPVPLNSWSIPARMIATRSIVHVWDQREDESYRLRLDRDVVAAVDEAGILTVLFVPLIKEGDVVGHFTMHRTEVRPFSEKQIALLENFAAQAVIAMDNARLLGEIRQRQAELRVTFDNMADGVVMFDAARQLTAWNRNFQEMLAIPNAYLDERHTYDEYVRYLVERGEFGNVDLQTELARLERAIEERSSYERARPDGTVMQVRFSPTPDGGFVVMYSDITTRKRAEEELRAARDQAERSLRQLKLAQANLIQAEKMASLGQVTAGIAHEIKNPLNFVNNFATLSNQLLTEIKDIAGPAIATLDADKRQEFDETLRLLSGNLEKIAGHGKRADNVVKSMLAHSRGSSGERQVVDLNALIEESLNLAYHGARAQDQGFNVTLECDFHHALKPIELVPQDVTRVFLNLFGNGFYATNKRARTNGDNGFRPMLRVTTRDEGNAVMITVRDNGTGIPSAIRDKLFEPFFTTKPTGEGTGLGLSISYDIVTQQHGGTITVDSEEGSFTEFTVRLPRAGGERIMGRPT
jgi:PAS domain S-box-containing protein